MAYFEVALAAAGSETAVKNLDLEDERTEGKAMVAMPQLIRVLEAILGELCEVWEGLTVKGGEIKGRRNEEVRIDVGYRRI